MMRATRADTSTAHRRAPAVGLVVGAVALALHLRWPAGLTGQLTYLLWTVGAAVVAAVVSRRLPKDAGRPWRWVALGLACSAVADVYYALHSELAAPIPDISLADPAWLASYVFLGAALFALLHERGAAFRDDIEGLIDTGMAIVVSSLVLWQLAVQPLLDDRSLAPLTRSVWSAYPVLDAALLALVMRARLR